jgi:F-type H+-transporting ATPase subunit alpha
MNVGISVSRVGGSAQIKAMKDKQVAGGLRLALAAFRELEAFAQLGTDLDAATQSRLDRGTRMVELLKQPQYQPLEVVDQIMIIYAGNSGSLDEIPVNRVGAFETEFLQFVRDHKAALRTEILEKRELSAELKTTLTDTINQFKATFLKKGK